MATLAALGSAFIGGDANIEVCPGEGPRYGDFKCNHDGTHRVCARLVDEETKQPLSWTGPSGGADFW